MGGRGATAPLSDGPRGGGGNEDTKWGQPDAPVSRPPAPNIRGVIGAKGAPIAANKAVKEINPYRDVEYGDYSKNCQRCVVAFELNRRGYKVEAEAAGGKLDPYPHNDYWMSAFQGGKLEHVGASSTAAVNNNITKKMSSWGEGSRGIVEVTYPNSNRGHVFNVEYHRGEIYFYDAQTGVRYRKSTVFNHVEQGNVRIMRSDNLKIADNVRDMVRKR